MANTAGLGAALCLLCLAAAAAHAQEPPLADDEKEVAAIVDQLGSADFEVRKAASQKLEELGPDVVPILHKYREHDDPEVRARINGVIKSFVWMSRGAVIERIEPGGRGRAAGLRLGDVIVKVNSADITTHPEVSKALNEEADNTWYIWRDGKVKPYQFGPGKLGIWYSNWDIAKGGNDQARGLRALDSDKPDYGEAYRRLKAAFEQGMTDQHSHGMLTAMASRQLDAETAYAAYLVYRRDYQCSLTHTKFEKFPDDYPFESPHTKWLLDRRAAEPFSTELYHQLMDWSFRAGQNGPLLLELTEKPWPWKSKLRSENRYDDAGRIIASASQRRFPEVLDLWENRSDPNEHGLSTMRAAILAAVHLGKSERAVELAVQAMAFEEGREPFIPSCVFAAFSLACVLDDQPSADRFLQAFDAAAPRRQAHLLSLDSVTHLAHPAAAARLRQWLAGRPRPAKPGDLQRFALAQLVADPATTKADFGAAIGDYEPTKEDAPYGVSVVNGWLRFGEYDRAVELAGKIASLEPKFRILKSRVSRTAADAEKYKEQLAGPWKQAAGFLQCVTDRQTGATSFLRYDGQVFIANADGSLKHPQGLPPPPAPVTALFTHLHPRKTSLAVTFQYGRDAKLPEPQLDLPDEMYVLPNGADQWTPLEKVDGNLDSIGTFGEGLAIHHVARAYPALPGGFRRTSLTWPGGYLWFEGNILIHVKWTEKKVVDLSQVIGKAAGREKPAQIYWPYVTKRPILLHTDCGLWHYDPATCEAKRVPLGLEDENVIVRAMPEEQFGVRTDGSTLVGVAPQHGGQVFIVDQALKVTKTGGYCGLGPIDWIRRRFTSHEDAQTSIHHQYLSRLADRQPGQK